MADLRRNRCLCPYHNCKHKVNHEDNLYDSLCEMCEDCPHANDTDMENVHALNIDEFENYVPSSMTFGDTFSNLLVDRVRFN